MGNRAGVRDFPASPSGVRGSPSYEGTRVRLGFRLRLTTSASASPASQSSNSCPASKPRLSARKYAASAIIAGSLPGVLLILRPPIEGIYGSADLRHGHLLIACLFIAEFERPLRGSTQSYLTSSDGTRRRTDVRFISSEAIATFGSGRRIMKGTISFFVLWFCFSLGFSACTPVERASQHHIRIQ
jgi:hypothetical protein